MVTVHVMVPDMWIAEYLGVANVQRVSSLSRSEEADCLGY